MLYFSLFLLITYFHFCHSHGYLADPPARSSAWLFDSDFSTCCRYYNHAEMFCGGAYYQWMINGGKCSICGEAYDAKPRLLGRGDAMYLGKIVRTYTEDSIIPVTVVLTANHRGVFEFRLCNIDNNANEDATQECLDLNQLSVVNGATRYEIESTFSTVHVNVSLPKNFTCKHCVFQWKYVTGNSWGVANGRSCLGCGAQNEEFYGCSDIAIVPKDTVESIVDSVSTSSTTITTTQTIALKKCRLAVSFSRTFDLTALVSQYCHRICSDDCASEKEHSTVEIYDKCKKSCNVLCDCD